MGICQTNQIVKNLNYCKLFFENDKCMQGERNSWHFWLGKMQKCIKKAYDPCCLLCIKNWLPQVMNGGRRLNEFHAYVNYSNVTLIKVYLNCWLSVTVKHLIFLSSGSFMCSAPWELFSTKKIQDQKNMPQIILKKRTAHLASDLFLWEMLVNIKTCHFDSSINHQ